MPIIDPTTTSADALIADGLRKLAHSRYRRAVSVYEDMLRIFWKSDSVTPQEISDALGTDAGDLFTYVGHLRTFILSVNPGAQITAPNSYGTWTVNGDGTVTINSVN